MSATLRAEQQARQAAREARATYYAHPLLHLHTYLGEDSTSDSSNEHLPPLVSPTAAPLNAPFSGEAPAVPVAGSSTGVAAEGPPVPPKTADALLQQLPPVTEVEAEEPNKAIFPRPGPTAEAVEAARKDPKAAGPNGAPAKAEPHWSTLATMQPHLQLMYVASTSC